MVRNIQYAHSMFAFLLLSFIIIFKLFIIFYRSKCAHMQQSFEFLVRHFMNMTRAFYAAELYKIMLLISAL